MATPGQINYQRHWEERLIAILKCAAEGMTTPEIAKHLHLSFQTIRDNKRRLRAELGARNMTQAVAIGYQKGLLKE